MCPEYFRGLFATNFLELAQVNFQVPAVGRLKTSCVSCLWQIGLACDVRWHAVTFATGRAGPSMIGLTRRVPTSANHTTAHAK